MELGYITFSAEEQQVVHDLIQQISQGAIDELGLGRIRDAFSDLMFPGMSTLHRKSKYFVLLPALYNQLAQTAISERKQIDDLIRQWEINMTISLMKGNKNHEGITGSSIAMDKLRIGRYVKIRPTHIYRSALRYYGLVDDKTDLTELIFRQSQTRAASKIRRTKESVEEDPDDVNNSTGFVQSFYPFTGYDFSQESPISLQLKDNEARILKEQIINKCRESNKGKDNLYSYILSHDDVIIEKDFFQMKDSINAFPEEYNYFKEVYALASDFSKWAHLMNTYYRYAFYSKMSPDDAQAKNMDNQKAHIGEIMKDGAYPQKERLKEILDYIKFEDVNGLRQFCQEASECLENNQEGALIDLIIKRERKIKGNHYKIGNERYKETNFSDHPGYYAYRWNEIVYSMIYDIRNPQP